MIRDFPGSGRRGKKKRTEMKLSRFMNICAGTSISKTRYVVCVAVLSVDVHSVTWME